MSRCKLHVHLLRKKLVMALPIQLVWNLQMPRLRKVAICMLFGTGLVCIAFATIRVLQIGINDKGQASTPEPKWLTFWGVLETSIAVIIGCCPAFAALIRSRRNTKRESSDGYVKHSAGSLGPKTSVGVKLKTIMSSKSRSAKDGTLCGQSHSSREQLASLSGGITIRTDLHQTESTTALPEKLV